MDKTTIDVPFDLRRGAHKGNQERYVDKGEALLALVCERLGLSDLEGMDLLDMGCGTRITQALMRGELPIGSYTGVDINAELIEHLQTEVRDPRLQFHYLDIHNDMYNPGGQPLSAFESLPVGGRQFDAICLFSVFTHLAPHDYPVMLKLLRHHVRPQGRLVYSLFVNETTEGGFGYIDMLDRSLQERPELVTEDALKAMASGPPDFIDDVPEKPLLRAIYSRKHALELIEGTGWEVEELHEPTPTAQHQMVCRPV